MKRNIEIPHAPNMGVLRADVDELKAGLRAGSNAALMKPVLEKLDEDDLLAIVAYLASLAP